MTREVAILIFPDVQTLDLVGPLEVFDAAHRVAGRRGAPRAYRVRVVAPSLQVVFSHSGLGLVPHESFHPTRALDTLIVAGGPGSRAAAADRRIVEWVRRTARKSRRVASVCTGAFVLAAAGLLQGKRATTHWAAVGEFQKSFPDVEVAADSIFVREGKIWTSAGVTAGMDLALALVEEDLGRDIALLVARYLVLFVRRQGGQSQFSVQLSAQTAERKPLRDVVAYVREHVSKDLSVPALASRAGMSVRHFARAFKAEVGRTPADYVERIRVEDARRLLETTNYSAEEVSVRTGFGTPETLRRTFLRVLGVGPADYRRRFQAPEKEEEPHGNRNRSVRKNHGARRSRPVRSPEPHPRRSRPIRRQA